MFFLLKTFPVKFTSTDFKIKSLWGDVVIRVVLVAVRVGVRSKVDHHIGALPEHRSVMVKELTGPDFVFS